MALSLRSPQHSAGRLLIEAAHQSAGAHCSLRLQALRPFRLSRRRSAPCVRYKMIRLIKDTLPNFPDEVIKEWLLPFAESEGWPPQLGSDGIPLKRWRYLLGLRPFGFFQRLNWKKEHKHISIHEIAEKSQPALVQIFEAAIFGRQNMMSSSISNLKERFESVVRYIESCGSMPNAPVLLSENDKYYIFDGNHRLSAYYYCYGYFKVDVESKLMLTIKENQNYWIAYQ